MYFHWASQTLLKNSRYTQPYGTCLCYKVCVCKYKDDTYQETLGTRANTEIVFTSELTCHDSWTPDPRVVCGDMQKGVQGDKGHMRT
jgi:hypothetical protein